MSEKRRRTHQPCAETAPVPPSAPRASGFRKLPAVWILLLLAHSPIAILHAAQEGAPFFHPPIGPFTGLQAADFSNATTYTTQDRLVLTPYFYWYDAFTGAHLTNSDGSDALTDHPPTLTGFSWRSPAWHRTQLIDMTEAGIDVLLPVYWGEPSQRLPGKPVSDQTWSFAGIPPLVQARDGLVAEGKHPPRIGLFYDTSTLQFNAAGERIDLTTARGQAWFYESVRDFFSLVPPRHWAMIDGRPVIFLYSAAFAVAHDQRCIDFLTSSFTRDFGGRKPYIVREISWQAETDQVYAWGGALGLKNPGTASLGPGYDHSAVPGREPLIVPREQGTFFERNWLAFLRRPSRLVMIETWNEYHEGTDIAASRQYGRDYIRLNRKYADLFKAGYVPPPEPGAFTGSRLIEISLGPTNTTSGLIQFESADGLTRASTEQGRACRIAAPTLHGGRFVYFRIEESFKWAETMEVLLVVDYLDAGRGTLRVEYDGSDLAAPFAGAYSPSDSIALSGSGVWRTATLRLPAARFLNRQNGGADLRLSVGDLPIAFSRVQILREGLRAIPNPEDTSFELQVYGGPGRTYDLQWSDDLRTWALLARLRPVAAVSRYLDPIPPDRTTRWFRLLPTPSR